MSEYVLAHGGDTAEGRRMALLDAYHGTVTARHLDAIGVGPGWRCLEVGAGSGAMTRRLLERAGPGGHVVAIDMETHFLAPLAGLGVEVRQGDLLRAPLEDAAYDLVVAQMLLLHLPDPLAGARRLLGAVRRGGTLLVHDADFTPLALDDATPAEAEGVAAMTRVMAAAGVHLDLGARLEALVREAGGEVEAVEAVPGREAGGGAAASITAITLERFRDRAIASGIREEALDAAAAALADPRRRLTGPTRWIVRARRA